MVWLRWIFWVSWEDFFVFTKSISNSVKSFGSCLCEGQKVEKRVETNAICYSLNYRNQRTFHSHPRFDVSILIINRLIDLVQVKKRRVNYIRVRQPIWDLITLAVFMKLSFFFTRANGDWSVFSSHFMTS